jgi:hypothetical protein
MSEGWGDFNGLLLQLRDGDNRKGTYAQGSYADATGTPDAAYFSIRRFPYSRDHLKNPLKRRLCGIIPPPRRHLVRYSGILGPASKDRHALRALVPSDR